jgi:hypothetical protein
MAAASPSWPPLLRIANLPIAVTAAGNDEFDDGLDALHEAAR